MITHKSYEEPRINGNFHRKSVTNPSPDQSNLMFIDSVDKGAYSIKGQWLSPLFIPRPTLHGMRVLYTKTKDKFPQLHSYSDYSEIDKVVIH